ncbi:MAG: MoaD/ThiS family protein [Campylobacteraceae bacterium]|jgi:molybdopterin synthase sulfur carrier subunit|nr:MoaD/ThiS family protein [Campylobacteraceae bacterium]
MATIEFLGPLSFKNALSVDIKSLKELKELLKNDADVQKWLPVCSVAVNDKIVCELDFPIVKDDKIVLLPPVCGG